MSSLSGNPTFVLAAPGRPVHLPYLSINGILYDYNNSSIVYYISDLHLDYKIIKSLQIDEKNLDNNRVSTKIEVDLFEDDIEYDPLPYIFDQGYVPADKLSIPEVYDVKDERIINSKEFFSQNESELILWRRSLQEEYLTTTNKIYETNKLMRSAQ